VGHGLAKANVALLKEGAGPGNLHRQGRHAVDLGRAEDGRAGKAPGAVDHHPHAQPLAFVVGQPFDHPVLDIDVLRPPVDDPDVGIACSLDLGKVQGTGS